MKTAVLVIDMLNDFFQEGRLKELRGELCTKINDLTKFTRHNEIKIIWVRQAFKKDLSDAFLVMRKKEIFKTIEQTEGSSILHELNRQDDDSVIVKKRYSAFFQTELDELLRIHGIGQLILCGVNTHACIRTAAIDAYQRDLEVIIAKECVNSYDDEHHEISLKYLGNGISRLMTNSEIESHLKESGNNV